MILVNSFGVRAAVQKSLVALETRGLELCRQSAWGPRWAEGQRWESALSWGSEFVGWVYTSSSETSLVLGLLGNLTLVR